MPRPVSTIVFGVLNLAFAAMGAMGFFMSTAVLLSRDVAMSNPIAELMQNEPGYALFMKIATPVGVVAMVVLALGGVGLLMLRPWGRYLSMIYGLYGIAAGIVATIVNCHYLLPLLAKAAEMPFGPERAGWTAGIIGGIAGGASGVIYPAVLVVFMFRRSVRTACQAPCAAEAVAE